MDRKLIRISRETGHSYLEILGFWTGILCMASESPVRGVLMLTANTPQSIDDIADALRVSSELVNELLAPMLRPQMDMLCMTEDDAIEVLNWNNRQFERDSSAQRTAEYRERKKRHPSHVTSPKTDVTVTVTACDGHSDAIVTLSDTDTETETEGNLSTAAIDKNLEIVEAAAEGEEKLSRSILKLCTLFGELNMPQVPHRLDHEIESVLRRQKNWNEDVAMAVMRECHKKARARDPAFRARSLSYYVEAINKRLEGKENGNANIGTKSRKRSSYGM